MKSSTLHSAATIIKFALALSILLGVAACSRDTRTISGTVVDESGAALAGAGVTACYSGWGWSSGSLVWDKDYCSDPVLTDRNGNYRIQFAGPESMRLRAVKQGWIQTRDFNSTHHHIILSRVEDEQARQRAASQAREQHVRLRQPGETAADYYCRVILPRTRPVVLNYHDQRLSIIPALLLDEQRALFALRGPVASVNDFAADAELQLHGERLKAEPALPPASLACEPESYLLSVAVPERLAIPSDRVELAIPSVRALLDLQVW